MNNTLNPTFNDINRGGANSLERNVERFGGGNLERSVERGSEHGGGGGLDIRGRK